MSKVSYTNQQKAYQPFWYFRRKNHERPTWPLGLTNRKHADHVKFAELRQAILKYETRKENLTPFQCDLAQPQCGQCIRGKWKCTQEATTVNTLGMGRFRVATKPSEPVTEGPSSVNTAASSLSRIPPPQLSGPLDIRALCYFRANYVVDQSRSFRYLETFYKSGDMSDHLSLSIQSVGVASLSRDMNSRELEALSRKVYSSALRSLNKALSSPVLAKKDDTLSSVILLEHFERILPSRERTIQAWTNHLQGASALMRIRGAEQFASKTGFDLYAHFSVSLMLNCFKYGIPLPAEFLRIRNNASRFTDTNEPTHRFMSWCIRFIEFRAELLGPRSTPESIIAAATELDVEILSIISDSPPEWVPQTIQLKSAAWSKLVYEDHYDIYTDYRVAEHILMLRVARLMLTDIMSSCEKNLSTQRVSSLLDEGDLGIQPRTTFQELASHICASVPQLAGYLPTILSLTPQNLPRSLPPSNRHAAYVLLWPLCALAHSRDCPAETRVWIAHQLRIIAGAYDLGKAWEAVRFLEQEDGVRDGVNIWNVFEDFGTVTFSFCPDESDVNACIRKAKVVHGIVRI